ncbi:MAG: hypothetical protein EOO40_01680 [Deltaproteobacteria bacterium]|nr:MAG: hypothetical protein EOO40_01680 [Deltaproteobacteria bacterium]
MQTVLSQIRIVTGQAKWQDPPKADITAIAKTQVVTTQAIAAIQPMVETTYQAAADQSEAIKALQQAVNTGQAQLTDLQGVVDTLRQMVPPQGVLQQAQRDIADLRSQLNAQLLDVNSALSAIQGQVNSQAQAQNLFDTELNKLTAQFNAIKNAVYGQSLLGVRNGVNLNFATQVPFMPSTLRLFYNGVRQRIGTGNDFIVSQGNATVGYAQVTLLARQVAPRAADSLTADYIPAT